MIYIVMKIICKSCRVWWPDKVFTNIKLAEEYVESLDEYKIIEKEVLDFCPTIDLGFTPRLEYQNERPLQKNI